MTPSDPNAARAAVDGARRSPTTNGPVAPTGVPVGRGRSAPARARLAVEGLALLGIGFGLGVSVLLGEATDVLQLWIGLGFVLFRLAGWWFRTYTVTERELLLDEGILQKRHRVVPFSRIQQGPAAASSSWRGSSGSRWVQVETAGDAGSTAVVLRFLQPPRGEALRDHLLAEQRRARGAAEAAPAAGPGDVWRGGAGTERVSLAWLQPSQLFAAGANEQRGRHDGCDRLGHCGDCRGRRVEPRGRSARSWSQRSGVP